MISLKSQTVICEVKMIYTYEERLTWTCGRKLTLTSYHGFDCVSENTFFLGTWSGIETGTWF